MKKTILGSAMMISGMVSTALLMAGSMNLDWTSDGKLSFMRNLSRYGLIFPLIIFILISIIGLIIAVQETNNQKK